MSKDVFETLAQDSLETTDGEVITDNQSTYSFDEVESLTDDTDEVKELKEQKAPKKEQKTPEKGVVKTKEDSQITLEDTKSKKESKKEPKEDDSSGIEEKIEENSKESSPDEEVKKISAKYGEDVLDIPSNALIPHKVDGEPVEIPLQELLNNYSGKQAWDKRFSELDVERKEYQKERDLVERYVNDFAKLAAGDDKMAAMEYLAEFAGVNPVEFRRQLREQVLEKYGTYSQMSEIERKALDQEEELSYHRKLQESENSKAEEQKAVQELQNRLDAIQETHNISEDELKAAYDELSGDYDGEITPEVLEKYVVNRNAWFSAKSAVSEVAPELIEQEGFVEDIADIVLSNPDLDADDIAEIISEFAGSPQKRQKQQKIAEKVKDSQVSSPKTKTQKEEYLTFDDL